MEIRESQRWKIRDIVKKYDLERLFECGCPPDEYDFEVDMIIHEIENTDLRHIEKVISDVFRRMFHPDSLQDEHFNYETAPQMAGEIQAVLREDTIQVAAAIIRRDNKILICRRGAGGSTAFLWEFPGGKLEPGETLEECVVRECREELSATVKTGEIFAESEYEYPDRKVAVTFFKAELAGGEIRANVHQDVKWVTAAQLKEYDFCPADEEIIKQLIEDAERKDKEETLYDTGV